jgi:hypothetical protein
MAQVINSNIPSLTAQRNLKHVAIFTQHSLGKIVFRP